MTLKKITVTVCHDSLKSEFTVPEDLNISGEKTIEELKKGCYKHSLIRFNPYNDYELFVMLDTVEQFATFVSWLAETIKEKW